MKLACQHPGSWLRIVEGQVYCSFCKEYISYERPAGLLERIRRWLTSRK